MQALNHNTTGSSGTESSYMNAASESCQLAKHPIPRVSRIFGERGEKEKEEGGEKRGRRGGGMLVWGRGLQRGEGSCHSSDTGIIWFIAALLRLPHLNCIVCYMCGGLTVTFSFLGGQDFLQIQQYLQQIFLP